MKYNAVPTACQQCTWWHQLSHLPWQKLHQPGNGCLKATYLGERHWWKKKQDERNKRRKEMKNKKRRIWNEKLNENKRKIWDEKLQREAEEKEWKAAFKKGRKRSMVGKIWWWHRRWCASEALWNLWQTALPLKETIVCSVQCIAQMTCAHQSLLYVTLMKICYSDLFHHKSLLLKIAWICC